MTIKQLRRLDAMQILSPALVDPRTRYRYYGAAQLGDINRVLALRQAGVLIRETTQGEDAIDQARRRISARIAADYEMLARLELLAGTRALVAVKSQPTVRVAALEATLRNFDDVNEMLEELSAKIPHRARGSLVGATWTRCDGLSADCQAFIEVTDTSPLLKSSVHVMTLPAMHSASLVIEGSSISFVAGYAALRTWISSSGQRWNGSKTEIYVEWPQRDGVTDIRFPLSYQNLNAMLS